jgi:16S rRNA (uracil1498-N3)-methyltransferase
MSPTRSSFGKFAARKRNYKLIGMHLFFVSGAIGDQCLLSEDESKHCTKVLRLKVGEELRMTDGAGKLFQGILVDSDPRKTRIEIRSMVREEPPPPWKLHIAMAPTKNIERFEWFLEKATEIGIDEITPLYCHHSERETLNMKRLEKVLITALKQSLRLWLPLLNPPVFFNPFVQQERTGQRFIAWCGAGEAFPLHETCQKGKDTLVLIGPEGDFSAEEVTLAKQQGYLPVSLGKNRLRTETAGIVACHTMNLINRMV